MKTTRRSWLALLVLVAFFCPAYGAGAGMHDTSKPVKVTEQQIDWAASLQKREEEVARREKEVALRQQGLAELQKDVDEKIGKLGKMQVEVQARLAELSPMQDKQFNNLIKIYSVMSAAKVAILLDKMDEPTIVQILGALKTDFVAKILLKLDPDRAVRVSKLMGMLK